MTVTALKLKKRTLTNLYNLKPQWLIQAHRKVDEAVAAAYGWDADISNEEVLQQLLELNQRRFVVAVVRPKRSANQKDRPKKQHQQSFLFGYTGGKKRGKKEPAVQKSHLAQSEANQPLSKMKISDS